MRRFAIVLVVVVGCSYRPGSFAAPGRPFAGERMTIDCLDLAVHRRVDMNIDGNAAAIIEYSFGNRCDDPVVIDLGRVPVIGRTIDGDEVTLTAYDPAVEMQALELDAGGVGREALAYPATEALAQVCVDASAIAGASRGMWKCFSSTPKVLREAAAPRPQDPYEHDAGDGVSEDRKAGDDGEVTR